MAKNKIEIIALKIAKTCIHAVEGERHFAILQEMHGFDGVMNFPRTIKDLIFLDQMDIFGISKEMQIILKHINQLSMLSHMKTICICLQREYEIAHKRFVVTVSIGRENDSDIAQIVGDLKSNFDEKHDFIFKKSSTAGIVVRYRGQVVEYTADGIAKMLKAI
jgi:hypothetical protein